MTTLYTVRKETPKRWSVMSPSGSILASYLTHEHLIHPGVRAMAHASELNEAVREVCEQAGVTVETLFDRLEASAREVEP